MYTQNKNIKQKIIDKSSFLNKNKTEEKKPEERKMLVIDVDVLIIYR
jgi:hypothetical protein